jgi:hypothetical protein
MNTSKSTKTSKSPFTGTSDRGDLEEAFRKAKALFLAARPGNSGEVSVTINAKQIMETRKDGTGNVHENKDLTATSPGGDLDEAFRKAKESFLAAAHPGNLGEVSVTINLKRAIAPRKHDVSGVHQNKKI